jgi:hypothetical protein
MGFRIGRGFDPDWTEAKSGLDVPQIPEPFLTPKLRAAKHSVHCE